VSWIDALPANRRRGSFPRCLLSTHGEQPQVAARLESLVGLPDVTVTAEDVWMPQGIPRRLPDATWNCRATEEAKLGEASAFLDSTQREAVTTWWLAAVGRANTPNWDIASTCSVSGQRGLLLVEAKAHNEELNKESIGKTVPMKQSRNGEANHERIGDAIGLACAGLEAATSLRWFISRDTHYQMSNRFAWAWKVASLGLPVVLVYLGFLRAEEMRGGVRRPFADHAEWRSLVETHSAPLFPRGCGNGGGRYTGSPSSRSSDRGNSLWWSQTERSVYERTS